MAVARPAVARIDRGADAGAGSCDRGNRAPRRRQPVRLRAGAGARREPAGTPAFLAGVSGRRKAQTADRDSCWQPVSPGAELDRLALLPLRILSRGGASVSGPGIEP